MSLRAVILILLFGVLGPLIYFGVIDLGGTKVTDSGKATVTESSACPGYRFVRAAKSDGVVDDYRAVAPDKGWKCQYLVNGGLAGLRFKTANGSVQIELTGNRTTFAGSNLEDQLTTEAQKQGFTGG